MPARNKPLIEELEILYKKFNDRQHRSSDPIQFAYRYQQSEDIEIAALISALFAYGNVKSMCAAIEKIMTFLGERPFHRLREMDSKTLKKDLPLIYYRFFTTEDIHHLLLTLSEILKREGSLKNCMQQSWNKSNGNLLDCLFDFREKFVNSFKTSPGLKFMFPHPKQGAAKRLHMFMRWMIRSDEVDLGIWNFIPASALIVPLDTHVFKAARRLRFTRRKTPSLQAALEVTQALKRLSPEDPLKYDFALCHSGMRIAKSRSKALLG
jgi:uncharacterized protein (TIGR02757 family)